MFKKWSDVLEECPEAYTKNDMLLDVSVVYWEHMSCVSLEITGSGRTIFGECNMAENLGHAIKLLMTVLNIVGDDNVSLSILKKTPVRLILDEHERCIGLGHFMDDRFVMNDDLVIAGMEKEK